MMTYSPEWLSALTAAMEDNPNAVLCGCDVEVIDVNDDPLGSNTSATSRSHGRRTGIFFMPDLQCVLRDMRPVPYRGDTEERHQAQTRVAATAWVERSRFSLLSLKARSTSISR